MNRKPHWENIYQNKKNDNVSWYQKKPEDSINLIESFSENKSDKIIDIGCGAGFLTDNLIKLGFLDITVIDISANAITYPPRKAPKGFPIPPTIAAANIGNMLLKYTNGL